MPRAFVIHGHDKAALAELTRFVEAMGIEVIPFHRTGADLEGIDTILGKVLSGITSADVVIVLFTPDEQANFHDPRTGAYRAKSTKNEDLGGWQPRPNVIFEAGVAAGVARHKTILVKLGPVRTISDLAGVMFVDMDDADAKEQLYDAIARRVTEIAQDSKTIPSALPGDFGSCRRTRWDYHDELGELESHLNDLCLDGVRETLLDSLSLYTAAYPTPARWGSTGIMDHIFDRYRMRTNANDLANGAFWHFMLLGVFSFREVDDGWDDPAKQLWWVDMLEHAYLTSRGLALLYKLRAMS